MQPLPAAAGLPKFRSFDLRNNPAYPNTAAWFAAISSRPAYQKVCSDDQTLQLLFQRMMGMSAGAAAAAGAASANSAAAAAAAAIAAFAKVGSAPAAAAGAMSAEEMQKARLEVSCGDAACGLCLHGSWPAALASGVTQAESTCRPSAGNQHVDGAQCSVHNAQCIAPFFKRCLVCGLSR